jgi:hypothetical protein
MWLTIRMSTTTKTIAELFLNESDGRICCPAHGGHYLQSAHDNQPDAAWFDTPLGTWSRWSIADEADWRAATGAPACCESCGATI